MDTTKAAVIGMGKVGATTAYTLMLESEVDEIVLIDINKEKAKGEELDLNHGLAFAENMKIYSGDYKDIEGADFVIITAGVAQKPGETRIELAGKNYKILEQILNDCMHYNKDAIYIIVSNPVDVLTLAAKEITGLPRTQIFGSGTNLDSSRYRYLISQEYGCSPSEVNAYILGEHGDSEFPLKSQISLGGIHIGSISDMPELNFEDLYKKTKNAAYEVIEKKEATYYAIALSVTDIVNDIMSDQDSIKPLSIVLEGEYGQHGVALSVPVVVGSGGIKRILEIDMTVQEQQLLKDSAKKLQKVYEDITSNAPQDS